jgi:hypothetical protein
MSDPRPGQLTTVEVQSAWWSKINWVQGMMVVSMLTAKFGFTITADQQAAIIVAIGVVGSFVTWVLRTWFTKTVTPSAAAK